MITVLGLGDHARLRLTLSIPGVSLRPAIADFTAAIEMEPEPQWAAGRGLRTRDDPERPLRRGEGSRSPRGVP